MPDNTINWGQGAVENTNDWGKAKANSTNNWGKVYETSPAGDTNIEGGLALSITYSASAYCDGIGDTPQPIVSGNTGSGTFSSTSGIIFADSGSNTGSSTGVIDVDASTDGTTYVITYTDTDLDTATANVTLNALDNAAFAYSASSYEPTDADPTPTITGLTGGTFSSTSGLVFVDSGTNTGSSTGQIDLSATTEATYTITYDTTSSASSVCPNTSTQTVEIAVAGIANNFSMSFDGSNDYIDTGVKPRNLVASNSALTISAWLKSSVTFSQYVLGSYDFGTSPRERFFFKVASNEIIIGLGDGSSSISATIPTNQWYNVIVTFDGSSTVEAYINGSSQGTASINNTNWNTTNLNVLIGAYNDNRYGASGFFSGSIDEVGIWNTELTSTQIQSIYNATSTNLTKDLSTVSGSNLKLWLRMGD